jgi:hypothetical protein
MTITRILCLCALFGAVGMVSPAMAGCDRHSDRCWWRAHHALYHMGNRIAYLEANPNVDDSDKGPIIDRLQSRILRLRAAIGPRWPHWPSPCCYSRRPVYIR